MKGRGSSPTELSCPLAALFPGGEPVLWFQPAALMGSGDAALNPRGLLGNSFHFPGLPSLHRADGGGGALGWGLVGCPHPSAFAHQWSLPRQTHGPLSGALAPSLLLFPLTPTSPQEGVASAREAATV